MKKLLQAGGLLVLSGGACLANVDDTILECASLESKDARIACLELALRRLDSVEVASAAEPGGQVEPAERVETESPRESVPAGPPAPVAETLPPAEAARTAQATPAASSPEIGVSDEADPELAGLGSEQVEARNRSKSEDAAVVHATVVDFDFVGYRRLLVQLDNGQIWRQIDGDRTSVERELRNETSFDVELWGTGLGGYRMRIAELDRTLRVERLK